MSSNNLISDILSDLKVELLDEFDKNFVRKAYFNQAWAKRRCEYGQGSLMMRSGALRRSVRARVNGTTITIGTSLPYAKMMNEGGDIVVTRSMKSFLRSKLKMNSPIVVSELSSHHTRSAFSSL